MSTKKRAFLFDLPSTPRHLNDYITNTHDEITFTPNNKSDNLTFSIILPKDWFCDTSIPSESEDFPHWRLLGLFGPEMNTSSSTSFVAVITTSIKFEIDTLNFLEFFCKSDGFDIFAKRIWYVRGKGRVTDIGAFKVKEGEMDVMRAMAYVHEQRIFVVCGVSNSKEWNQYKNHFLIACSTFTLTNPKGTDTFEKLIDYGGGNPFIGVSVPESWTVSEQTDTPKGKSAFEIQLIEEDDVLAYIMTKASTGLEKNSMLLYILIEEALQELELSGFKLLGYPTFILGKEFTGVFNLNGWVKGNSHLDPLAEILPGYFGTAIISGKVNHKLVEARLGFRILGKTAFTVYLISVPKESDYSLWSRSKRAFEFTCAFLFEKLKNKKGRKITNIKNINGQIDLIQFGLKKLNWKIQSEYNVMSDRDPRRFNSDRIIDGPTWVEDSKSKVCMNCKSLFTVTRRRHHCRNCGLLFCKACSSQKRQIPKFGFVSLVRVCDNCAELLNNQKQSLQLETSKKKRKINHVWSNWKTESFIEVKVWENGNIENAKYLIYTLKKVDQVNNQFTIRVEDKYTHKGKTITLDSDENIYMFDNLGISQTVHVGDQVLKIYDEWFKTTVWTTTSQGLKPIVKTNWMVDGVLFPVRTIARNEKTLEYSERFAVKMTDEVKIGKKYLPCIKFQGYSTDEKGKKTTYSIWMSEEIPGGIVKVFKKSNNQYEELEVIDYKAVPNKGKKINKSQLKNKKNSNSKIKK
ncbi:arrestin domain-containing protein d [Anaeramoeba flamelloides]|uniref:Arrestin domain-containing protein d n=2 Tax=Anaeramoeba flamelloides TaxID=1746091 RepID=A0AAV7Y967_9EUKA|nr:arrestin domain-containing protein d [Anaeramoeba flamelloides]